ncbi:tRNA1(Val) (adenine(37)-N6)-methyltransferase [Methylobacterium tardum]|uniref:Methyltransferase n=1 Tax=Methylobacterium tardum TaxID=374432 RepID=A0AA37WUW6_9HYPH|nr:methyltransferase [Methylobacterium tardum]URD36673.1 methyltransferase [Methylobacterium tardum]GJE47080.1 tRNA1(Val) (adenine(37)-N6)-methyltransferase [Methylobacterium tardum]GLS71548.1 methyltransferase [Methylobacterium tardum]
MSPEPDGLLGGRLRLHQPPRGAHRAGTDAILLAQLLVPAAGDRLCDAGASTGAVGLGCAALVPGLKPTLIERDHDVAELARANAGLNGIEARVIEADLLASAAERRAAGLLPDSFDVVLTNPPFFDGGHRTSPNPGRATAHTFAGQDLDAWIRSCTAILRPGGRLGLIHRADALPACLNALKGRYGGIAIRPVHARAEAPAIRLLISATKGSRAALSLRPPLVLHDPDGSFTPEAAALHRGAPWPPA